VLARGFERGVYSDDAETAWLAGSVAGVVGLNEVQRFHRRCEAIKRQEGFKRAQFWLVAEEKFNQAAMSFAESQGLFTSSLEQLRMLAQEILPPEDAIPEPEDRKEPDNYQITIPMSADSELVAVRAFEQIAEGMDFSEKAKGQVRMALMEACINIKEAFGSDTGKIHLGFKTAENHLSVRLRPEGVVGAETDLVKAWGMKMLKTLMDDVKLHRTAQGFELVMVKRSIAAASAKSEAV
jgi:anti-sigma regulatory factor (Ser/Thr protein kinase)